MAGEPVVPFGTVERALRQREFGTDDPVRGTVERLRQHDVEDTLQRLPSPEAAARVSRLSRDTQLPSADIEGREDEVEAAQRARAFSDLVSRSSAMGRWAMGNPRGAAAAQDDTESLGLLGNAWEGLKNIGGRLLAGTAESTAGLVESADMMVFDPVLRKGVEIAQPWLRGVADETRAQAATLRDMARAENWFAEAALSGLESVPVVAAAALTRNPTLATAIPSLSVFGSSRAEGRRQGLDETQAALYGGLQGGIEFATERIPMGTLVEAVVKRTPFGKAVVRQLATELPGEQVATVTQDMVDWAMLPENQDKTFGDYLRARPEAALQTAVATVSGTASQTALARSVQGAAEVSVRVADRVGQARQARREAEFFDRVGRAAEGSNLRQRDPEAFRALLREQAQEAGATSVFIPGETVREFQQSDRYNPDADPFVGYDVEEAAATGGDVVIPIEDALTDLVGTPAWEAVRDDMRLAPGGMSARDAATFEEAMEEVMAELGEQAARIDAMEAEQRTVREKIVDRVAEMFGVSFTSPTARTIAELFAQRAQTRATRLGQEITEESLQGFEVRQVMPEGVAQAVAAGKTEDLIRALKRRAWDGPDKTDATIKVMRSRKSSAKASGPSLLKWITSKGGIEDRGGDLAAMAAASIKGVSRKGQRKIIRPHAQEQATLIGGAVRRANTPEALFEAAISEGFFPEFAGRLDQAGETDIAAEKPDLNVFLDAIAAELRGEPRYAAEPIVDPIAAAAEDLRAMLEDAGFDPDTMSDIETRAAIEQMAREASEGGLEQGLFGEDQGDDPNLSEIERQKLELRSRAPMKGRKEQDGTMGLGLFDKANQRSLFQEARGQISFDQNKRIIELFQSRNLSTPLHELSHMWLEELRFDAEQEGAPEQLKADWETAKAYFAANGHKIGKDGQIPTEAHELWARSGERYFMEGKAPTSALVRLFESFRAWLVNIYKTVDRLKAPITPEIREVFDRLLATDEEIAAAQERQGLAALFKDAAGIGMSEPEFQAYQRQVDDARAGAHASLLDKTMATIRRREQDRYREARKKIRAEETERIDAAPVFKALATMKEQRVSKEWIVDNYGEDALDLLPVRVPPVYASGGVAPQIVAELSGYRSGAEMIEALIGAERAHRQAKEGGDPRPMRERAIETATDEEFARRYGDPLNDGSIEREALAAVHSEMQGEVIASELRVLSRKTGRRPTPYALAKEWARGKIRAGTVAQEASPSAIQRYARNAAKAGREAEKAMLAQDADETFRQKQFQMMNNALVAEAKAAHDEVTAAASRMDKIAHAETRKSVEQDYLEQAQALLEAVDLRPRSQKSIERQGKWAAFAAAREAEGFDIVVPAEFEATINRTHWSRLSVENLLALDEAVKQVIHLGRLKQTLLDNAEEREWDEIYREAEEGADNIGRKPPKGSFTEPTWWDAVKSRVATMDAALLKMEQVFDWLDEGKSNGVFNRIVFKPIAEAQGRERDMTRDYFARIRGALEAVPAATIRRWGDKVTLDLIDPATGLPAVFERKKLVSMALNWGNAGNRQRLADGYGWSQQGVEAALMDNLSEAEWHFVQRTWDIIDTLWPEIEKMERAINGVAPEKVEATEIVTPFGTLKGGYYPAIYDTALDYRAEEQAGRKTDLFEARYVKATTRASATKDRMEKVSRPILLDIGVINRHLGEVIHDVTHREAVMRAHKFLTSRRVMKAVDETLGPEVRQQFRPWLQHVANSWAQDRAGNEGVGRFMSKARANTTVVGMGWRFTTMLTQLAGYSNSFEKVGAKWVSAAIAQSSAHPIATFDFVMSRSAEMRGRMDTLDRDIRAEIGRMESRVGAAAGRLTDAKRFAFHGIGYMDRVVSIPTWIGAYNKALSQGMTEEEAGYAGDKAVRLSQGAAAPKDLAAVATGQGKYGEALKWLTMFYSYLSTVYSRQRNLGRDWRRGSVKDLPALMARAWWLIVVPPLLAEILSGRGPGDDEDEAWWAFKKMLSQSLGAIPGVRDLVEPALAEATGGFAFGYRLSPVQAAGESVVKVAKDAGRISRGEDTTRATRNVLEMVGYTTGLVPGQIAASTQFLVDVGYGEADPETIGEWYTGLSKGRLPDD